MIGRCRTVGVVGWYWISSSTSLRKTTAPGDTARLPPTLNGRVSTCDGMPPLWRTSDAQFRAPFGQRPATRAHGALHRRRVAAQGVRGGERLGHLHEGEPGAVGALLVEVQLVDRTEHRFARAEVGLRDAPPGRVPPGRVGEAAVLRVGRQVGRARQDARSCSPVRRATRDASTRGWRIRLPPHRATAAASCWPFRPTNGLAPLMAAVAGGSISSAADPPAGETPGSDMLASSQTPGPDRRRIPPDAGHSHAPRAP